MLEKIANKWWVLALQGFLHLGFGIAMMVWNNWDIIHFRWLLGGLLLVEGVMVAFFSLPNRNYRDWWVLFSEGALSILVGSSIFLIRPELVALKWLMVVWSLATGLLFIVAVLSIFKDAEEGESSMGTEGVLSILMALTLLFFANSFRALVWVVALYTLIFGFIMISLALSVRKLARESSS